METKSKYGFYITIIHTVRLDDFIIFHVVVMVYFSLFDAIIYFHIKFVICIFVHFGNVFVIS